MRRRAVPLETWAAGVDGASVRPLNVLVILVDSLRPDQLESGSAKRSIMPNLDALARRSRVFTDTLCQASNSAYADPCVLSSHYPLRSQGVYRYEPGMTAPRVLFYDVLSQLGWTTGIFSSQNEYWEGMIHYLDTGHVDRFVHAENFAGPTYMQGTDVAFEDWAKVRKRAGKIEDKYTIGELIGWIDEVRGNPFCAYVNLQNSHSPFELPPGATRRFGPEKLDFTVNFAAFPVEKVPVVLDLYADCLSYVDEQLGRLFDHLTEAGLLESTIVIVSGDTGQAFHEHGFAGHGNALYDEVMRVPLVLWAPGLAPGLDDRPAQHVDVPPTVNALLGLPPHPAWQGLSLVDADTHPDRSRFLVVQTPFAHQFAVVRSGFKLIYDARSNRALLYDRRNDPGETRDVSAEHPELTQELSARLAAWYRTQIEYNADTALHAREYPPVLIE